MTVHPYEKYRNTLQIIHSYWALNCIIIENVELLYFLWVSLDEYIDWKRYTNKLAVKLR